MTWAGVGWWGAEMPMADMCGALTICDGGGGNTGGGIPGNPVENRGKPGKTLSVDPTLYCHPHLTLTSKVFPGTSTRTNTFSNDKILYH